jgi:hypothetical protein
MEPCPAERINLSRLNHFGFAGSNFKNLVNKTVATSAIPIGRPGCPLFACCTASIDKNLIALARSLWVLFLF